MKVEILVDGKSVWTYNYVDLQAAHDNWRYMGAPKSAVIAVRTAFKRGLRDAKTPAI